jgi:hypothetical protein
MEDKREKRLDDLFRVARTLEPRTEAVENLFEVQVQARIRELKAAKGAAWNIWDLWTWRLVPLFTTIAVIIGMGGLLITSAASADVFSYLDTGYEEYLMTSMLTGG